jgi:mono/diheme cytochrome c family protein
MRQSVGVSIAALFAAGTIIWAGSVQTASGGQPSAAPQGERLFRQYCASCHGIDGKGPGPVAAALKVGPPDLTTIQAPGQKFPSYRVATVIDGEKAIVAHGTRKMPVWGAVFRQTEGEAMKQARIYQLVKYVESIQIANK